MFLSSKKSRKTQKKLLTESKNLLYLNSKLIKPKTKENHVKTNLTITC